MEKTQDINGNRPEVKTQVIAADNGTYKTEQKNDYCCPVIAPTAGA